jgi:hypothetical protein
VLAVLICLTLADCATGDNRSDDNRFGGAYGGINGGVAR